MLSELEEEKKNDLEMEKSPRWKKILLHDGKKYYYTFKSKYAQKLPARTESYQKVIRKNPRQVSHFKFLILEWWTSSIHRLQNFQV